MYAPHILKTAEKIDATRIFRRGNDILLIMYITSSHLFPPINLYTTKTKKHVNRDFHIAFSSVPERFFSVEVAPFWLSGGGS